MTRTNLLSFLVASVCLSAAAGVEWTFPRTASCHEGLAFADGVTGVLVWGGGETVNLTVGRADLWDNRGGTPWTPERNYRDICALAKAGANDRIKALFVPKDRPGVPRFPRMLPLGRIVVKVPGAKLVRGELDPFTGLGILEYVSGAGPTVTQRVEIAMSKTSRTFAMRFPDGIDFAVTTVPAMSMPRLTQALARVGFKPARMRPDGFDWDLPADPSVSLTWKRNGRELFVRTDRGGENAKVGGERWSLNFDAVRAESVAHWKAFWAEGARVKVPDPVLQRIYDYGMYRFGAMTDPDGVPAGLQGPWLEDDRLVPWNGDYHFNINVQECYSPAYRGGHFRNLMPLFRMILSWRPVLRANAKSFVGIDDGYVLPHALSEKGVAIGSFWAGTLDHASTAWAAKMMFDYVKYSGDEAFLRDAAYDFMKGAMNVYLAMLERSPDGTYALPMGPSPEWGEGWRPYVGRNPSFQLAAIHRLARDLGEAASRLGETPDPRWAEVDRGLPPYVANGERGILIFEGEGLLESHRHHSHMAGFYPFDTFDLDDPATRAVAEKTYGTWILRGMGAWSGWSMPWASVLQTHVGNADAAVFLLRAWDTFFCNPGHGSRHDVYRPGLSVMRRGDVAGKFGTIGDGREGEIMQMDGQCASAAAVLELLVHEVNGRTDYFRGCPAAWADVSFENVALSDGRRVSGRRTPDGRVVIRQAGAEVRAADYPSVTAAIADCAAKGGGRVTVAKGVHVSNGPVVMKSNVELHLEDGATILFSDNVSDYLPGVPVAWEGIECYNVSPLVYAYGCTNVAITGTGTLKAKMDFWWTWAGVRKKACESANRILKNEWSPKNVPVAARQLWKLPGAAFRPQFLHFNRCRGVRLEGFRIRGTPFWTIHTFLCNGVTARNLDVDATGDNGRMINNSDGFDVDGSKNVLIENCTFCQGDDALVFKSGKDFDGRRLATPTENVVVRNCTVRKGHNLAAVGSELSGGIRNVHISDCQIVGTVSELVHVKTNPRRGGFVENVVLENITVGELRKDLFGLTARCYFGGGGEEAFPQDYLTPIRDITIRNVRCKKAPCRVNLRGDYLIPVENVTLENVVVDEQTERDYVANVKNLRINGQSVPPTATVATAEELGAADLSRAIWQPETREYVMAFTDGTVRGSVVRRSRDRKLWSEPWPAFCFEDHIPEEAIRYLKIRRESDGWYLDVRFASGDKTYFTPEIFWPFRPKEVFQ